MSVAAPTATLSSLADSIRAAGRRLELVSWQCGTKLLILPEGGRVLGLFREGEESNFFWTHPALDDPASAARLFADPHWVNPGGDRTWLAPEHEFFIADLARPGETYRPPPAVDGAVFRFDTDGNDVTLTARVRPTLHRSGRTFEATLTKTLSRCANPLRDDRSLTADVSFAGLETAVTLSIDNADAVPRPIGLWQLLQLPPGGDVFVPTLAATRPRVFFGEIAPADLIVTPHCTRFRMADRTGSSKIATCARATVGRAGYLRHVRHDQCELVIRNFSVNPSGEYVDVPLDALSGGGFAFQACNVAEPAIGYFAEIEHHAPAIGGTTGKRTCTDVAQVWAFRGPAESIIAVGRALLGDEFGRDGFAALASENH